MLKKLLVSAELLVAAIHIPEKTQHLMLREFYIVIGDISKELKANYVYLSKRHLYIHFIRMLLAIAEHC